MDKLENVLERLGVTENTTITVKREEGGKIRITSLLWEAPKVILKGEVLEIRTWTAACTTLALKREDGGKIRVTSMLWENPKVILRTRCWKSATWTAACTSPEKQQFASAFVTNIRRNGQNPT